MLAIYKRELASFFRSPVGYVAVALYALLGGFYFMGMLTNSSGVSISAELTFLRTVFIVVIPVITMRLFSEEKKNGTDVLMYTAPVPLYKIVLGKYLASVTLLLIMLSSIYFHTILVVFMGGLVDATVFGAYIGFIFLAAMFISVGSMASALTENQIIAAVVSFVIILFSQMMSTIATSVEGVFVSIVTNINFAHISSESISHAGEKVAAAINWFDPYSRTDTFSMGVFEISPLVFCLSLTALFLFLTYRILEKKRWSQG